MLPLCLHDLSIYPIAKHAPWKRNERNANRRRRGKRKEVPSEKCRYLFISLLAFGLQQKMLKTTNERHLQAVTAPLFPSQHPPPTAPPPLSPVWVPFSVATPVAAAVPGQELACAAFFASCCLHLLSISVFFLSPVLCCCDTYTEIVAAAVARML